MYARLRVLDEHQKKEEREKKKRGKDPRLSRRHRVREPRTSIAPSSLFFLSVFIALFFTRNSRSSRFWQATTNFRRAPRGHFIISGLDDVSSNNFTTGFLFPCGIVANGFQREKRAQRRSALSRFSGRS